MELTKVTDRIWYYPFEKERDRPILGYIKGDKFSVAVDAGHSEFHLREFYSALANAGLPLPQMTVLTHWHWDHTFALHAIHGSSVANKLTDAYLRQFKKKIDEKSEKFFLSLDECIRREYEGNKPVIITFPHKVFSDELTIDAGSCPIRLIRTPSPHTDDSTLVVVENEKVLFLGDAAGGTFPTWVKNPDLCHQLADIIDGLGVDVCLESHHEPQTKRKVIDDLRSVKEY